MTAINEDYDVQLITTPRISKRFSVRRIVTALVDRNIDARYIIPKANIDYSSLNITLQSHTLSDSFTMTVPKGTAVIDDVIKGSLYGWDYDFTIIETETRNQIKDYIGRYSSEKLFYTNYKYVVKERYRPYGAIDGNYTPRPKKPISARTLMGFLAGQLGLTLYYNAWDWFYPLPLISQSDSYGFYGISGTYQSIITSLFGWLNTLPHIDFCVTIRNGGLYVTQRGQEPNSYTLQTVAFPPAVHLRKMRTEWAGNADWPQNELDAEAEQQPFTGTISFGDNSNRYENGLLIEQRTVGQITRYKYTPLEDADGTPHNYISLKETINGTEQEGTCSRTQYNYGYIGNDIYLESEYEETGGDIENGVADYSYATVTETKHIPLGNGWYGTTVTDVIENEVISTSLTQGNASNAVTPYMIDKTQDALRSDWSYAIEGLVAMALYFANPPLIPSNYPVMDEPTLEKLVKATDWLNGKTEETVSLDTYDEHIIDLTQKVIYNGNTYNLDSNNITHDEHGLRQSLVLKRWY